MDARTTARSSIKTVTGGIDEKLTVVERRATRSARLSSHAAMAAAAGLAAALYFTIFTPGAIPSVEELTLSSDVATALQQLNNRGGGHGMAFDSIASNLTGAMIPMIKVMGVVAFALGLFIAVLKQSFGALFMSFPMLAAGFFMPAILTAVDSAPPARVITIECVSERRCFSTLNEAAPAGTAGRHFINAQLYAFGRRPEAVARELSALRASDDGASIEKDNKEVMAALLIAAGETPDGEHAAIVAAAAEEHDRGMSRRSSALAVAGIAGGIATALGMFAFFLRRRVRSIKDMLKPITGHREDTRPTSLPDIEYAPDAVPTNRIDVTNMQSTSQVAFPAGVGSGPGTA